MATPQILSLTGDLLDSLFIRGSVSETATHPTSSSGREFLEGGVVPRRLEATRMNSGVRITIFINITVLKYGELEAICIDHGDNVSGRD